MSPLKGGTTADFTGSMAEAIEKAMEKEYQALKGASLPATGQQDRRMLFASIASGILNYLEAHQDEMIKTITIDTGDGPTTATVSALDLDVQG